MRKTLAFALALLPAFAALAAAPTDVRALRQEIAALELDHALQLSATQAKALLPVLQTASAQIQAFKAQRQAANPALVAALTQARDELRATGTVSDATRQAVKAARGDSFAGAHEQMQSLRQQIHAILTPEQIQALRTAHLGVGGPGAAPDAGPMAEPHRGHGGHGFMKQMAVLHTLTSAPFLALVQARAG
jgi:Spy/CpxP family protein refolding chaperone